METRATFKVVPATRVKRRPERGSYDRRKAYSILDEALYASVGFTAGDTPFVIPMVFARRGERLVLHGATTSRLQGMLASARICVTVTLVDGIVLARSAMHHSMNYRSVVVFGRAEEITDPAEKLAALAALVDHVLPGRSAETRPPNELELRATRLFSLPIEEASVKERSGGPLEDEADLALPYWGGVIPLALTASPPAPDPKHAPRVPAPGGALRYTRRATLPDGDGEAGDGEVAHESRAEVRP